MIDKEIKLFSKGVNNLLDDEIIPQDAASSSNNWVTQDGKIKLVAGKLLIGNAGVVGKITGEIFGYKTDGSKVHWRKAGTKIQYLNGSTWTDTVTGLTSTADYTFTNYSSLAGSFTFAFGVDGIYKFNNACPQSYCSMYDSSKNFKGFAFIDKGRTILWNRAQDKTGLYGSWIDNQRGVSGGTGVYTTVTSEAITDVASGTLAFKAGGATRNCFGVTITDTSSGEVFTDNYLGVLTGSLGNTGTINYITGAFTITGQSGAGTATYQWEDSNVRGVTDFSKSATRLAGEGFQFPQDEGGDPILQVLIGSDGYYSMKKHSAYKLSIDDADLVANNLVYRKELGLQSSRGAVSTSEGIVFVNTSNQEKPELTRLQKNLTGDAFEPKVLFPQFKFANYVYDDCTVDTYERYVLVACKSINAVNNDTILMCDMINKTVDIVSYTVRTFARDGINLYMGSSLSESIYQLFSGFDDDGYAISNFWTGKGDNLDTNRLKKYRKLRLKGNISADQSYAVYIDYDSGGKQLIGTVLGSGSYVDYSSPQSIGSNFIGSAQIGGDDLVNIFPYFVEIRLKKVPKFRKRQMTFVALGIGYVDIDSQLDLGISTYENKIPSRYRQKQNVSLNGQTTNLDNPEF